MSYITGPAIITIASKPAFFFEQGLKAQNKDETVKVTSDFFGEVDVVLKSRMVTFSGKPVGMVSSSILSALFPNLATGIGTSLMTGTDVHLVVSTLAGQAITWQRIGITKMPNIILSASAPNIFDGEMEITALGAATTSSQTLPTNTSHWNSIASTAFSDTSFDTTKFPRYRYLGAWGSSPYDAMTAQSGFKIDFAQKNVMIPDDNVGIADIILQDIVPSCKFTPSNLTEAQIWTMINLQGAAAAQPGDSLASATDLVISGTNAGANSLTFTLKKAGFTNANTLYQTGKLRAGEIMAVVKRGFTSGVPDAPFSFTLV
jgi:hypothetical protein